MPPNDDDAKCPENTSVRDEAWDRCVKRSSLSIGLGTLVGAVSSIFVGTSGVMFSMSLCVAWAVNNCRSLFREQKESKKIAATAPPVLPKSPKECKKKDKIESQAKNKKEKPTKNEKKEKKQAAQSSDKDEIKPSKVNYSFPSVFPIPDRPFGGVRGELEKLRTLNLTIKPDKNQPPLFIKPQNVQQDCIQSPPGCQDNQGPQQQPPPPPPPKPPSPEEEEEFNVKLEMGDDSQCECTIERYSDCIHVDCVCPVPKFAENDQCTCDDNAIPNFTIKCQPPESEKCECTCDDYDDDSATAAQYDDNNNQGGCDCHPQTAASIDACTCS